MVLLYHKVKMASLLQLPSNMQQTQSNISIQVLCFSNPFFLICVQMTQFHSFTSSTQVICPSFSPVFVAEQIQSQLNFVFMLVEW